MTPVDVSPALPRLRRAAQPGHVPTMSESTDALVARCRAQRLGEIPWPSCVVGHPRPCPDPQPEGEP